MKNSPPATMPSAVRIGPTVQPSSGVPSMTIAIRSPATRRRMPPKNMILEIRWRCGAGLAYTRLDRSSTNTVMPNVIMSVIICAIAINPSLVSFSSCVRRVSQSNAGRFSRPYSTPCEPTRNRSCRFNAGNTRVARSGAYPGESGIGVAHLSSRISECGAMSSVSSLG